MSTDTSPMLDTFQAILERLAVVEERLATIDGVAPEAPEECKQHRCSYWSHYLMYGPAELNHDSFHIAEQRCDEAQRRFMEWLDAHQDDALEPPKHLQHEAERWEKKVRA